MRSKTTRLSSIRWAAGLRIGGGRNPVSGHGRARPIDAGMSNGRWIDASTIGSSSSTNSLEYEGRSSSGVLLPVQHRAIEGMLVQRFTSPVAQGSCASLVRVCGWGLMSEGLNTEGRHLMRPDLRNILIVSEGGGESARKFLARHRAFPELSAEQSSPTEALADLLALLKRGSGWSEDA